MDSSNPQSGDQDSTRPGPGQGPAGEPAQGNEPAQALTVPGIPPADGGRFWPPGRWRRPARVAVGLGVAAALAAGGVATAVAASGSPPPPPAQVLATGPGNADNAELFAILGLAGAPGALPGPFGGVIAAGPDVAPVAVPCGPAAFRLGQIRVHRAIRQAVRLGVRPLPGCARLRPLAGTGMYGQFSYQASGGSTRTVGFERGVIQSVSGSSVTVKAANGQTETWQITGSTVIRQPVVPGRSIPAGPRRQRLMPGSTASLPRSTLAAGRYVLVAGEVQGGTRDIRLAIVWPAGTKPPAASVPPPSPAPSASASGT